MNKKNDFSDPAVVATLAESAALFFRPCFMHLPDLNRNSHGDIFNLHFIMLLFIKLRYFFCLDFREAFLSCFVKII